jgi:hypothetical protein
MRGGCPAVGMDYQDIGEALIRGLRVDYTYPHPEVPVERRGGATNTKAP